MAIKAGMTSTGLLILGLAFAMPAWAAEPPNQAASPATLPDTSFSLLCGDEAIAQNSNWTNRQVGLLVRKESTPYPEFNAVEWRLHLEQSGSQSSPILDRVLPGDFILPGPVGDAPILHYSEGSHESPTDFRPLLTPLPQGQSRSFAPREGRSSDGVMPYFNLARQTAGGWVVAVGWTGQWKLEFLHSTNGSLRVRVGQERFHAALQAREHLRTPSILVMAYDGDWLSGQNKFRQLMLSHFTPRIAGRVPDLPIAASGALIGFNNFSESNQLAAVDNILAKRLPVDTWWMDAGWMKGGFPLGQGNLEPEPLRFPRGLRSVGDRAHAGGLKFLLWFEPERVMPGTWLRTHDPRWLLAPSELPPSLKYQESWRLLNFGHPEALAGIKTNISQRIRDWGVDIYRHDCNIHPACYWRTGEAPDRIGIAEARYISGLYEFFDYLREQHPRLLLDNCASGGRRLDFEMMRRSVVLWRSDHCWQSEPDQAKTYGLSMWLPLQGLGTVSIDPYAFRSGMGSCGAYALNFLAPQDPFWEPLAGLIREQRQVRHLYTGDFHPLTSWSTNHQDLIAWQFHRPDTGEGLVQAFRRPKCAQSTALFPLRGLDSAARYRVIDLSLQKTNLLTGSELLGKGLPISLPKAPCAAIVIYAKHTPLR